ncbi:MAG: hypothetical protein Q8M98_10440 [Candidatus Cloacimonadaceae bacterium]|nr:hypothetical protein [Candidatus Cloacimonadaceae bacterium]
MPDLTFKLILVTDDANLKLAEIKQEAESTQSVVEKPAAVKISAEQALATIRDVKIAVDGVIQVVGGLVRSMNGLLDASLAQRQAVTLAKIAFGEAAAVMGEFASAMQSLTNFEDDQLLALMSKLSQTFKLNKDEIQQLVPLLLDFTEANKATGMSVESAFDLMGRALNGHTEMLGRYGIELDDTRLKTEGVSYLVEKLGEDYGGTAIALADLRLQNANAWGDIKETIGDMLNVLITPLLQGLRWLMEGYQNLSPIMKGFVTGLLIAIPVIGTVTTAVITLTAAYHALKIAINPVAGIIGLAVGAVAGLGFAYASTQLANQAAMETQDEYKDSVDKTAVSVESLVAKHREIAFSIDYAEAKRRLGEIKKEMADYEDTVKKMQTGLVIVSSDYFDRQKERTIEAAELAKKIAVEDSKARAEFNKEKVRIETEATLTGIALLEYKLEYTKQHYKALGAVTALNADEQISTLERIKGFEQQLVQAKQRDLDALQSLQQKYDTLSIDDAVARRQRELSIQRDAELEKARSLNASETVLTNISSYYAKEITKVEADASAQRVRQAEIEQKEKQRIAEEEKRKAQELEDTRYEFAQRSLDLAGNTYQAELDAIDNYYAKKKDKLIAAGLTEQQITVQSEAAKARIRNDYEMRNLQGAQQIMRDLAKASEIFGKKGFALWKTLAIGQAMIDTYASATAAYKSMVGIPVVGPGLAVTAAAAAIGAGLANIAVIQSTEPPKAATGGLLIGNSHKNGGIIIEAEGDEYITAKDRVKTLGRGIFDFLNFAPLSQVKLAFAGLQMPSVPLPASVGSYYGSGGSISSNGSINALLDIMGDLRDQVVEMKQNIKDSKSIIEINVDPLSNDPVRVSEIADTGKQIRSEV